MTQMNEVEIVKQNYDENPQKEWDRLDGFRYEFEITKAMFIKYLKPCKVLDIGGGAGSGTWKCIGGTTSWHLQEHQGRECRLSEVMVK